MTNLLLYIIKIDLGMDDFIKFKMESKKKIIQNKQFLIIYKEE